MKRSLKIALGSILSILVILILTNPSPKQFKEYVDGYYEMTNFEEDLARDRHDSDFEKMKTRITYRKKNYFLFSIYEMKFFDEGGRSKAGYWKNTFIGVFGNFIEQQR